MYHFKYNYPNWYEILRILKCGLCRVQIVWYGSEIAEEFVAQQRDSRPGYITDDFQTQSFISGSWTNTKYR